MVRWRSSFCCILLLSSIAGSQEFDECDEPPRSQSAKLEEISQNNFPINTVLTYSCRPGYKAVPGISNSITCQENLSWSILQEFCKPHDCGTVPDLPNGKINYPSGFTTFSSEAIMSCNEGYRLNGRTKRTCLSDGWDNGNPTCVPVMCPKAEVKDGQTVYENGPENQFNTSVSIKCNEGFTLRGSLVAACNKDGQWDPPLPNCEVIICPQPEVKHGQKIKQTGPENHFNTSVTFECNEGFTLNGNSIVTCNEHGFWDPALPMCEAVICPQPEVKDGQKVNESGRGSQFNTSFTFECNEGFTLRGSSVVTCNKDGHWDPPLPKCEVVMCPKLVVQNGQKVNVTGPENQVNTSVTIKCNKGFILRGTSVVTCNKHGRWDPPLPTCEEIVCAVPQITDGLRIMVSDQHNRFGSSWTFRCDKGFTMNGSPTVTCGEKGVWIPSRPTCQRLKCKDPQITEGLKITKLNRENVVGSSVTFKCENGFTMNGRNTVTCNEEGVWDPSPPTCQRLKCKDPEITEGLKITKLNRENVVGSSVTFKCENGFTMNGRNTVTCNEEGVWDPSPPTCQHASHTPWSLILTVFAVIGVLICCGGSLIFYKKYHQGTYNIKDSKVSPEPYMSSGGYSMSSTKYCKFGEAQPNKYCATNASYYLNEKSVPLGTVSYISVLPVAFGQSCHLPDAGLNTHAYHENKQKILYIPSAGNIVKPVTQYKAQNT